MLERSHSSLFVWETREKLAPTALDFADGRSIQVVFGQANQMRLWVEWTGVA